MAWQYHQSNGKLYHDGKYIAKGDSGKGNDRDQPGSESHVGSGPIPRGKYSIQAPHLSPYTGPKSLRLIPHRGTRTHGRSGFLIHGDSLTHPGHASNGCIVLGPQLRERIWNSGDHELEVLR